MADKVIYKPPKAMSLQAFKMALLKKRLAEATATASNAAAAQKKDEAKGDVRVTAELKAAKEREERRSTPRHAEAAEEVAEAREAADRAQRKVERLREEFEEEAEIEPRARASGVARQGAAGARAQAAEHRAKLEELAAREASATSR